jgi:GNAT superfamily N-acetyltransferase
MSGPRLATKDDIAGMHRVRIAVRENRLSDPGRITPDDYRAAIEVRGRGWVIETEGEIVAFAVAYANGNIWALFVDPAHEGRGHGHALHARMTEWLWSLGLQRLWLSTAPRSRAEGFYRSLGWQPLGVADGGDVRFELARTPAARDDRRRRD